MNKFKLYSLAFVFLGSTMLHTSASQAGEAKIDTLKQPIVAQPLMSEFEIKEEEVKVVPVNATESKPEITTLETEPKVEIDDYQVMILTAFTSGYESTQKKKGQKGYGITASGKPVQQGVTAACPKSMPFGTKIYVKELDHTYVCLDRGSRITEKHIDIYFDSLKEAKAFGRKNLHVRIVNE